MAIAQQMRGGGANRPSSPERMADFVPTCLPITPHFCLDLGDKQARGTADNVAGVAHRNRSATLRPRAGAIHIDCDNKLPVCTVCHRKDTHACAHQRPKRCCVCTQCRVPRTARGRTIRWCLMHARTASQGRHRCQTRQIPGGTAMAEIAFP